MRSAFFAITYRYPMQVLATFDPGQAHPIQWRCIGADRDVARKIGERGREQGERKRRIGAQVQRGGRPEACQQQPGLLIEATPAYFIAWGLPHTTADLLFYCVFGAELAVGALLTAAVRMCAAQALAQRAAGIDA